MAPASQGCLSTNWNSGEEPSKRASIINETANVTMVVHSAAQRALRFPASLSPGSIMMNSAPTSGRNVVIERIGQLVISVASRRKHEPGHESRNADQHGESVVVEIAGLDAHDV